MEYIELRQLVNKCLMGDIQISKQILLTSGDRTETTMVSFLNHLMKYNKIKKENLFTFYFKLIDKDLEAKNSLTDLVLSVFMVVAPAILIWGLSDKICTT